MGKEEQNENAHKFVSHSTDEKKFQCFNFQGGDISGSVFGGSSRVLSLLVAISLFLLFLFLHALILYLQSNSKCLYSTRSKPKCRTKMKKNTIHTHTAKHVRIEPSEMPFTLCSKKMYVQCLLQRLERLACVCTFCTQLSCHSMYTRNFSLLHC